MQLLRHPAIEIDEEECTSHHVAITRAMLKRITPVHRLPPGSFWHSMWFDWLVPELTPEYLLEKAELVSNPTSPGANKVERTELRRSLTTQSRRTSSVSVEASNAYVWELFTECPWDDLSLSRLTESLWNVLFCPCICVTFASCTIASVITPFEFVLFCFLLFMCSFWTQKRQSDTVTSSIYEWVSLSCSWISHKQNLSVQRSLWWTTE